MRLVLDPRRQADTVLGFEWLEPVSYGYDNEGILQTILCKGLMSDNSVSLIEIQEPELSEDLMMNYSVWDNTQETAALLAEKSQVILHDVLEGEAPDITLGLEVIQRGCSGIVIYTDVTDRSQEQRVVIENHEGKLMVHVWATNDSLEQDPTHSIEIE